MAKQIKKETLSLNFGPVPPQSIPLEEVVLGACLIERDAFEIISPILRSPENFYMDAHQKIYEAMKVLHESGSPIDVLTVGEALRKSNNLEIVGGLHYLYRLSSTLTSSAHIEAHARIVFEKFMKREQIRIAGSIISDAYNDDSDVFDLNDLAIKQFSEITEGMGGDNSQSVGDAFFEMLTELPDGTEEHSLVGVDTGYHELNNLTTGFLPGQNIIIAARPSNGKTALMLNLAENAVTSKIKPAGAAQIYSLETGQQPLIRRMAACRLGIPLKAIKTGKLADSERTRLEQALGDFRKLPIKINNSCLTLAQITASIRYQHKKYLKTPAGKEGLPFMALIDFIQLVAYKGEGNREQQLSHISRTFKLLAQELNIILIDLCQLNREIEKRTNKRPTPGDLRESGAIEQDADMIIAIYHCENSDKTIDTFLCLLKNKDGECGDIRLDFAGDIQKWKEYNSFDPVQKASFFNHFQNDNPYAGIRKDEKIDWDEIT